MKTTSHLSSLLSVLAFIALLTGCSTTQETENLLSAAGFKIVPASTPEQKAHLNTLPPNKVTMTQRDGSVYFVYPDVKQQALYVGQEAQYQEYQRLQLKSQLAADQVEAAQMNSQPGWDVWGPWEGGVAIPVIRR